MATERRISEAEIPLQENTARARLPDAPRTFKLEHLNSNN